MARRVVVVPGPAWRPPAYRPPPPRLGHELGQGEIKYNWGNLGQSILFGALGAGAMYGAPLLPDPMKTIAMVGGVGLIGYGVYSFLGQASKQDNEVAPGTGTPIPTPAQFSAITGQFLQPKEGSSQGFNWFSDTYPVKILVSNSDLKPVTITFELIATEYPKLFYFIPLGSYENYFADSKTVEVPPGGNKTIDFSPAIKMSRWLGGGGKLNMELTLRKIRRGGEAVDMDHVSFTLVG